MYVEVPAIHGIEFWVPEPSYSAIIVAWNKTEKSYNAIKYNIELCIWAYHNTLIPLGITMMMIVLFIRLGFILQIEQFHEISPTTTVIVTIVYMVALPQPHLGKWIHSAYLKLFRGQAIYFPVSFFCWVTFRFEIACYCFLYNFLILAFKEISCINKWKSQ